MSLCSTWFNYVTEQPSLWRHYHAERWGIGGSAGEVYCWKSTVRSRHLLEVMQRREQEQIELENRLKEAAEEEFLKSKAFLQDLEDDELCVE